MYSVPTDITKELVVFYSKEINNYENKYNTPKSYSTYKFEKEYTSKLNYLLVNTKTSTIDVNSEINIEIYKNIGCIFYFYIILNKCTLNYSLDPFVLWTCYNNLDEINEVSLEYILNLYKEFDMSDFPFSCLNQEKFNNSPGYCDTSYQDYDEDYNEDNILKTFGYCINNDNKCQNKLDTKSPHLTKENIANIKNFFIKKMKKLYDKRKILFYYFNDIWSQLELNLNYIWSSKVESYLNSNVYLQHLGILNYIISGQSKLNLEIFFSNIIFVFELSKNKDIFEKIIKYIIKLHSDKIIIKPDENPDENPYLKELVYYISGNKRLSNIDFFLAKYQERPYIAHTCFNTIDISYTYLLNAAYLCIHKVSTKKISNTIDNFTRILNSYFAPDIITKLLEFTDIYFTFKFFLTKINFCKSLSKIIKIYKQDIYNPDIKLIQTLITDECNLDLTIKDAGLLGGVIDSLTKILTAHLEVFEKCREYLRKNTENNNIILIVNITENILFMNDLLYSPELNEHTKNSLESLIKDKGINTEIFFYNNSFDLFLLGS
jgi:hypothetical protein